MVWLVGMNLLASWEGLEVSMVLSSISCFPQVVVTCDKAKIPYSTTAVGIVGRRLWDLPQYSLVS